MTESQKYGMIPRDYPRDPREEIKNPRMGLTEVMFRKDVERYVDITTKRPVLHVTVGTGNEPYRRDGLSTDSEIAARNKPEAANAYCAWRHNNSTVYIQYLRIA